MPTRNWATNWKWNKLKKSWFKWQLYFFKRRFQLKCQRRQLAKTFVYGNFSSQFYSDLQLGAKWSISWEHMSWIKQDVYFPPKQIRLNSKQIVQLARLLIGWLIQTTMNEKEHVQSGLQGRLHQGVTWVPQLQPLCSSRWERDQKRVSMFCPTATCLISSSRYWSKVLPGLVSLALHSLLNWMSEKCLCPCEPVWLPASGLKQHLLCQGPLCLGFLKTRAAFTIQLHYCCWLLFLLLPSLSKFRSSWKSMRILALSFPTHLELVASPSNLSFTHL